MATDVTPNTKSAVAAGIMGLAVGDALGVPVEFCSRKSLRDKPVAGMREFGTHGQPAGTWSDDTSLTLCLMESLAERGIDYADQAERFVAWLEQAKWTPHGEVFDIGMATNEAIHRLARGVDPTSAGSTSEFSNGNGSLMRILPVALCLAFAEQKVRAETAMQCSRLTHGHPRCLIACVLFVEVAAALVRGTGVEQAVSEAQEFTESLVADRFSSEAVHVLRIFNRGIGKLNETEVTSDGYVVNCLEASLWCALRANSYREGVLAAVNLGEDTDTTAAVAGALLGLHFGLEGIPEEWQTQLARRDDVIALCERFQQVCERNWMAQTHDSSRSLTNAIGRANSQQRIDERAGERKHV